MFVRTNRRLGHMGDSPLYTMLHTVFVNPWNFWVPGYLQNWSADPANQAPLTAKQIQDLANAAVQAKGINPNTNQPIAPQYAKNLPQDQAGLDALVSQTKAKEIANIQRDYASNVQQLQDAQDASTLGGFPWGLVLAGGAVLIVGGVLVVKAVKP